MNSITSKPQIFIEGALRTDLMGKTTSSVLGVSNSRIPRITWK